MIDESAYQSKNVIRPEGGKPPLLPGKNIPKDPSKPTTPPAADGPLKHISPVTPPEKEDKWQTLDLHSGVFKSPELYKIPKNTFVHNMRDELKGKIRDFATRDKLTKNLAAVKGRGITRTEFNNALEKTPGLTNIQKKLIKRQYKAYK